MPAGLDGGALQGGAPRAVWFASESDPSVVSARSVAHELQCRRQAAHLVWNPFGGDVVQMVALTRAARLLDDPVGREGRVCAQIMVVASSLDPFTDSPMFGLDKIMSWLDSWHVPRRWPAGPPLPPPQSYDSARDRRVWARGGHFGSSQVPGAGRLDPGRIDIWRIIGRDETLGELPRPRAGSGADSEAESATGDPVTAAEPVTAAREPGPGARPAGPAPVPAGATRRANGRATRVGTAEPMDPLMGPSVHTPAVTPAGAPADVAVPGPSAAPVPARASIHS